MALPTYVVSLVNGSFVTIKNVTATPALVDKTIKDTYYRDEGPDSVTNPVVIVGTDSVTQTDAATGVAIVSSPSGLDLILTDEQMHIEPRQLEYMLSYWEFIVAPDPAVLGTTFSYFYRFDAVLGMETESPSFF